MKKNIDYGRIPAGYYDNAMIKGNAVQSFWHREKFSVVIKQLGDISGKTLLDIGCGPGTFLSLLPQDYKFATGIDISPAQIDFASKKNAGSKKIAWIAGDPLSSKLDSYDVITSVELVEHLDEAVVVKLFECIKQHLKSGGRFVVTTPNYKSLWPVIEWLWSRIGSINYSEQHVTHFTENKLREFLEHAGFTVVYSSGFFIISPFLAIVSHRLAKFVQQFEQRFFPHFCSIIICEAICRQKV